MYIYINTYIDIRINTYIYIYVDILLAKCFAKSVAKPLAKPFAKRAALWIFSRIHFANVPGISSCPKTRNIFFANTWNSYP